jgi:hypothetical protein
MISDEIQDLIDKEPFEPFRLKLVNGDAHDIMNPGVLVVLQSVIMLALPDQNWVIFPHDKVNSLESLLSDYQGTFYQHADER